MFLDTVNGQVEVVDKLSKKIIPKSNWAELVDSVTKLGVINLPDMSKYSGASDAFFVVIEIPNKNSYRLYSYVTPIMDLERYDADSGDTFINFLNNEFTDD